VFKARWQSQDVAVKCLKEGVPRTELDSFKREAYTLASLRHTNIVSLYGVVPPQGSLPPMIVSEMMQGGTLNSLVHRRGRAAAAANGGAPTPLAPLADLNSGVVELVVKLRILRDVAAGVAYLHSRTPPTIHRDLSSVNVLLTGDVDWLTALAKHGRPEALAKVADFGLARHATFTMTAGCGNLGYMAPEVFKGQRYSTSADMHSFSYLAWETLTEVPPFHGLNAQAAAYQSCVLGARPPLPPHFPAPLSAFLAACWAPAPEGRPTFRRALAALSEWLGMPGPDAPAAPAPGVERADTGTGAAPMVRSTTIVPSVAWSRPPAAVGGSGEARGASGGSAERLA